MSDNEVRHVSSTGGQKAGNDERHDLIPEMPLRMLAKVYGYGTIKYDDDNWRKGYNWRLSFAALLRHVWKFWRGEDLDDESNLPHLAHAAWHCFTLLEFGVIHPEFDTRLKTLAQRAVLEQPKDGPRQWDSLEDVPTTGEVWKVVSRHGCHWRYWLPGEKHANGAVVISEGGVPQWLWNSKSDDKYDRTGPFTEDIDTETNDSVLWVVPPY